MLRAICQPPPPPPPPPTVLSAHSSARPRHGTHTQITPVAAVAGAQTPDLYGPGVVRVSVMQSALLGKDTVIGVAEFTIAELVGWQAESVDSVVAAAVVRAASGGMRPEQ